VGRGPPWPPLRTASAQGLKEKEKAKETEVGSSWANDLNVTREVLQCYKVKN